MLQSSIIEFDDTYLLTLFRHELVYHIYYHFLENLGMFWITQQQVTHYLYTTFGTFLSAAVVYFLTKREFPNTTVSLTIHPSICWCSDISGNSSSRQLGQS